MEDDKNLESPYSEDLKKKKKGNIMLFIIIATWLLFYLYIGSKGGVG